MIRFSKIIREFSVSVAALTAWGQSFNGTIVGLITDSTAAVIPNVSITILNEGTGAHLISQFGIHLLSFERYRFEKLDDAASRDRETIQRIK